MKYAGANEVCRCQALHRKRRRVGRSLTSPLLQIMYAVTLDGLIYHLVIAKHYHRTYCGLYVFGDLYIVEEKPEDRIVCQRCERIVEERRGESGNS